MHIVHSRILYRYLDAIFVAHSRESRLVCFVTDVSGPLTVCVSRLSLTHASVALGSVLLLHYDRRAFLLFV